MVEEHAVERTFPGAPGRVETPRGRACGRERHSYNTIQPPLLFRDGGPLAHPPKCQIARFGRLGTLSRLIRPTQAPLGELAQEASERPDYRTIRTALSRRVRLRELRRGSEADVNPPAASFHDFSNGDPLPRTATLVAGVQPDRAGTIAGSSRGRHRSPEVLSAGGAGRALPGRRA